MNPNSSLIWLPAITVAGLPVPPTITVPYNHGACAPIFDGEQSDEVVRLVAAVRAAAAELGYPVFIRTDLSSAKHSGPSAFMATCDADIPQCLFETLEDNEMKFWMEREGPTAVLVRKFLNLDFQFTAFGGLRISREWRLFADETKVLCSHPYWPAESLEDHIDPGTADWWRDTLKVHHEDTAEMPELHRMAIVAARDCGGHRWSVDFCRDDRGKWWLIDMARAEHSYHWPGCPNGGSEE